MDEPAPPAPATPDPWNIGFGVVLFAASVIAITVWFPHDIKGEFIEKGFAGKTQPGDAFFPVLLAGALAVLSLLQVALAVLRPPPPGAQGRLQASNLVFLLGFHLLIAAGIALMVWVGPLAVTAMQELGLSEHGYRQVSDTAPYKYLGFLTGGFVMALGLIAWAEGRIRAAAVVTVIIVLTLIVLLFDVALSNVMLPPNADQ